jgi:magnesium chelatase accessory protein
LAGELSWERDQWSWPNRQTSRFISAAGIRWHVQQAGVGPALLLVHGTGSSTHTWRDFLPELARDYTVVAPDLPGHGFTESVSERRYSIGGMCASVAALVDALKLDVSACIGHSAGAAILCKMALERCIQPGRIVSLNGAFLPFAGAANIIFSPIAKLLAASSIFARLVAWGANDAASVERLIAGTGSRLDAAGVELYARLVRDPRHIASALAMMGNWDLHSFERELTALRTPLTLIVGDRDLAVPPDQARRVQEHVHNSEIRVLKGLGHLAHEEAPALVLKAVRAALRAAPPR